jgi:copper chaperone CopZ
MLISCSTNKKEDPLSKIESVQIDLPSMVCGSCSKTIQKAIYQVEGVKGVDVNLEKKIVQVKYVPFQTNLEVIETAVTEAGYDANNRKRNPDAYQKLDACCKIDG